MMTIKGSVDESDYDEIDDIERKRFVKDRKEHAEYLDKLKSLGIKTLSDLCVMTDDQIKNLSIKEKEFRLKYMHKCDGLISNYIKE